MTKPTIGDLRTTLAFMAVGQHSLDDVKMLAVALDELERLRRLEATAKATYESFKCFQYSVHMGDQTQKPETEDIYSISHEEMLRMREALADLGRWFIEEECRLRGFEIGGE